MRSSVAKRLASFGGVLVLCAVGIVGLTAGPASAHTLCGNYVTSTVDNEGSFSNNGSVKLRACVYDSDGLIWGRADVIWTTGDQGGYKERHNSVILSVVIDQLYVPTLTKTVSFDITSAINNGCSTWTCTITLSRTAVLLPGSGSHIYRVDAYIRDDIANDGEGAHTYPTGWSPTHPKP